jgi:hypothetical protein
MEVDYLRRSAKFFRMDRIQSDEVRRTMDREETIIERVERKGLKWCGHGNVSGR